jgi:hypothetical protein
MNPKASEMGGTTQVNSAEAIPDIAAYNQIRGIIMGWPLELRATLVREMLDDIFQQAAVRIGQRPIRDTLSKARGMLRTEGPPLSDEEIEQMLDERRMSRYK